LNSLFDLSGRVAVVIGGTSGLGKTAAVGLAQHGANVVPTGRRLEKVREVCAEIEQLGRRTLVHPADVLSRESLDHFRDAVLAEFGGVDIVLYAAGVTQKVATADMKEDDWSRLFDSNVTGALRCAQSFYLALKQSRRGRLIFIASLGSFVAFYQVAAYCASKSAILALARNLGCEWAKDQIMVNAIVPGVFPTDLNRSLIEGTPRGQELLMRTPMGRFGQPAELIGAAVFLASDAASFVTGQSIAVDGGFLASGVNS
jgi:NAD(P)-dependent dehydrogenase (short-subunit alcohol dehydrogenase family)